MTQPFSDPAPIGGVRPAIRDLDGRLVAITPLSIVTVPNTLSREPGATQRRITADIMVIDGGPLQFGGNPTGAGNKPPTPHTLQVSTPWEATAVYISQTNMVAALERNIGAGVVLGRITRGQANSPGMAPPWNLIKIDHTDPGYATALQLFSTKMAGGWVNPVPVPIAGAPAPTLAHTHAATQPHTAQGQPIANPAMVPNQLGAAVVGALATLSPPPTGIDAGVWATLTPEQRAALTPAAPSGPSAPPGWLPEIWATLSLEQQAQIAGAAAQPANPW